jgi:hypothetical protein
MASPLVRTWAQTAQNSLGERKAAADTNQQWSPELATAMPNTCSSPSSTPSLSLEWVLSASTAGPALGTSSFSSSSSLLPSTALCLKARRHARRGRSGRASHMRLIPLGVLITLQTKERSPTCKWRVVMAGVCLPAFSLKSSPLPSPASSATADEFAGRSRFRTGALHAALPPALRCPWAGASASSRAPPPCPPRWLFFAGCLASRPLLRGGVPLACCPARCAGGGWSALAALAPLRWCCGAVRGVVRQASQRARHSNGKGSARAAASSAGAAARRAAHAREHLRGAVHDTRRWRNVGRRALDRPRLRGLEVVILVVRLRHSAGAHRLALMCPSFYSFSVRGTRRGNRHGLTAPSNLND